LGAGALVITKTNYSKNCLVLLNLLIFSFLVPREFSFGIGDFQFNFFRLFNLLISPYIFYSIVANKRFRWLMIDTTAVMVFLWPVVAYSFSQGFSRSFESGGVLFLETAVPYFLARVAIVDYNDVKKVSKRLLLCIIILFVIGIFESFTGKFLIHEVSSLVTGNFYQFPTSSRLGLWRAMGPTDHPIVFGTICVTGVMISYVLFLRQRKYLFAFIASLGGAFFSLSSAPLLAGLIQLFLGIWSKLLNSFKYRWWLLLFLFILFYVFVDLYSNRDPFRVMFSYLLLNSATGYARYYMWINGTYLIGLSYFSMLFGYGNSVEMYTLLKEPYWAYVMSRSVDSFWLVQLIQFGWPILLFNFLFTISVFKKAWRRYENCIETKHKRLLQAWLFSGLSLTLIGFTVDFWGNTAGFYYIILAVIVSFNVAKKTKN